MSDTQQIKVTGQEAELLRPIPEGLRANAYMGWRSIKNKTKFPGAIARTKAMDAYYFGVMVGAGLLPDSKTDKDDEVSK